MMSSQLPLRLQGAYYHFKYYHHHYYSLQCYYILQGGGRHANECYQYDLPTQTSASPSREGSTASQRDRCHY